MICEAKTFAPAPWLFEKLKILMLDVSELPFGDFTNPDVSGNGWING